MNKVISIEVGYMARYVARRIFDAKVKRDEILDVRTFILANPKFNKLSDEERLIVERLAHRKIAHYDSIIFGRRSK